MKSDLKKNLTPKRWVGWFSPRQRPVKSGPFIAARVEIADPRKQTSKRKKLIVSLPSSSGNAVKRNRFRREIRTYFEKQHDTPLKGEGIWIRFKAGFKISNEIGTDSWKKDLEAVLEEIA